MMVQIPASFYIVPNCSFNGFDWEHVDRRGTKFYTKLELPLSRRGYRYMFESTETARHIWQDFESWILSEAVIKNNKQSGESSIKRLKYLNKLDLLRIPRKRDTR